MCYAPHPQGIFMLIASSFTLYQLPLPMGIFLRLLPLVRLLILVTPDFSRERKPLRFMFGEEAEEALAA